MKPILLLLSFFFTVILSEAQIKRNFDGNILGKTTKDEIKSYLTQKHQYYEEKEGGNAIQSVNEISFGGVIWSGSYYKFYNDTLYCVTYTKIVKSSKKEDQTIKYKELREHLHKKYLKRNSKDNSNETAPETLIKDKSTQIKLTFKHSRSTPEYILKINYLDIRLDKLMKKKNMDDL